MTADKPLNFHQLRTLHSGDSVYARMESRDGAPFPRFFLGDFGSKPLIFGKTDETVGVVMLTYHNKEGTAGLNLYIDGSSISSTTEVGKYHLAVGINAPEVLKDEAAAGELPVFVETKNVKIGMSIDQIVDVDQQSETFTIVGSLHRVWQDPALAFSPDTCNCPIKSMDLNALMALANKNDIFLPLFTFFNQQGNRWTQDQAVFIDPLGKTTYRERFTVTLQAPDFDFTNYPFDSQKLNVHIDLSVPTQIFSFEEIENPVTPLGDQLGEEEWLLDKFVQVTNEVPYAKDLKNSRFTTTLEMKRHLIFYVVRISVPMILILCVSWMIFF